MHLLTRFRSMALGAGGLLAIALMAGRLSGLGRELILASQLGISAQADVAVVLLTVPDLLVNLLLSGGLSAALVPRLRSLHADAAAQLFQNACLWAALAFGALASIVAIWPDSIFAVFAPGLLHPTEVVGRHAMVLLALSIPLTALSGITAAYLNAYGRFFVAGLGTLIFNLIIIAALVGWGDRHDLLMLAGAVLAGAAIRLLSQMAILPRHALRWATGFSWLDRNFSLSFVAGIAASSLTLAPQALVRAAASLLGTGSVASFNYAQKLVELPLGIMITTISTVALTRLSGQYAEKQEADALHTLQTGLRLSLLLAIMVLIFGEFLIGPVASLVFLRGAINEEAVDQIIDLTRVVLVGVPFVAVSSLAAAALNAQLRTPEVLRSTAASIGVLVVLAVPGLLTSSSLLLMGAVVGSQVALAWFLARRAGICLWGEAGTINRQSLKAIGSGLAVAMIFGGIAFSFFLEKGVFAIALGAIGFAAAVGTSVMVARS